MEANSPLGFSSAPAASGPKAASGDGPFGPGSALGFSPQGKSLNGPLGLNGFPTASHPSASGPLAPSSPPAAAQPLRSCDCLWGFTSCAGPRDGRPSPPPPPPLFALNGTEPPGPGANPRGPELWGSGGAGPMGLGLDSQELYGAFHEQGFELVPNGAAGFYGAAQPFPEEPGAGDGGGEAAGKGIPVENGAGLVGSVELEEAQPELKMCGYNGAAPGAGGPGLGAASPLAPRLDDAPILSEDPLEPFGALGADAAGPAGLYSMDDAELGGHKSPLGDPPDPDLHQGPFSLLPPPLLTGPGSPPLHESSVELNSSSHVGLQEPGSLELDPTMGTPESPAPSEEEEEEEEEEEAAGTSPEAPSAPGAAALSSAPGDAPRRRIATQEEVRFPLQHGWRREVRIKRGNHRWQGETWYYGPCGKRMKQFPEVIKYLSRNQGAQGPDVRREHFSFSPRMPVGDFYEERETAEGLQWVQLSPEEIPSRIQAITGKRGRPRNAERPKGKEGPGGAPGGAAPGGGKRGRGRPPKARLLELLSKADARLLKRLEGQEALSEEDKARMNKIKKKMRRKARSQQQADPKPPRVKEPKRRCKAKAKRGKAEKGKEKTRGKERRGRGAPKGRREQRLRMEEMRKPTEDLCLGDHQPLPPLSRIPGLVLPGAAVSRCLAVLEFLRGYGRVLGLEPGRDVPSLSALQEGLLGLGDSAGRLQDLLVRLLRAALGDPGLPHCCQSLRILGEKVPEIRLSRDTVSEVLRCFLAARGAPEGLWGGLRTKPFQALPPGTKASILAFLVDELNGSARIISEIDKSLESMAGYRRNKWVIEGRLRRLRVALAKRSGRPESELPPLEAARRRRSSRLSEGPGLEPDGEDEEEETRGRRWRREEELDTSTSSIPELERQIEKLAKRQMFFRKKLLHSSQMLRAASLGQDRYRRRYWVLPHLGGIFVEGAEEPEPPEQKPPAVKPEPEPDPEPVPVPVAPRVPPPVSR
ncbi:bromodomain adjacent to zinc finger domain protein 2A, partial [Neopsephotus bourkii]|uniref:bromodomain adjacent to zinc finger domain protein 2A n=1 Tax=Neopsephotus bourkii TaxID=309878 RepID=UPI002AA5ADEF